MCDRCASSSSIFFKTVIVLSAALIGRLFLPQLCLPAAAQVSINELYYDHPGTDTGFEFIELINMSPVPLSLYRFRIEFHNGAGAGWSGIWSGSTSDTIPANGLFVVGETDVNPRPDAVVTLALQNGPDAIRLVSEEVQLDLVGYGALDDPSYYETSPAPDVTAGFSLGRSPDGGDSDDNLRDFAVLRPSPSAFNIPRRDLSIEADPRNPRIIDAGAALSISFLVRNDGTASIPEDAFTVELWDSNGSSSRLLDAVPGRALEPGERAAFGFQAGLPGGYHRLQGRLRLPGDERSWNDRVEFVVRAGTPPVLISEVMSYPASGCPQYVEIFNCGPEEIECAGWLIRDASHAPVPFPSLKMAPREYIVLTPERSQLLDCFSAANESSAYQIDGSWPYLNHTGSGPIADSVEIADKFGLAVDRIGYPPQESALRGLSMERVDLYPGTGKHTWILSSSPYGGTPGEPNSIVTESPPSGGSMACSPNPFSLRDEVLLIEISAAEAVERVVIAVYDLDGIRLRDVGSAERVPALFVWDGRGRNGSFVGAGIYIVACETYFRSGGMCVERVVVGCGENRIGRK